MRAKPIFCSALVFVVIHTAGCQSWQAGGFPMQNATRVPPPGTGTYSLPSGYYNNATSALSPDNQTLQAGSAATSGLRTASALDSGRMPSTNLTVGPGTNNSSGSLTGGTPKSTFATSELSPGLNGAASANSFSSQGNTSRALEPAANVVTASYQRAPNVVPAAPSASSHARFSDESDEEFTDSTQEMTGEAPSGPSDRSEAEAPSLQWQQFGGQ